MRILLFILAFVLEPKAKAETKLKIIGQISAIATAAGIDPDLAVAIATVESSLNPKAIGPLNEQGLFQLRPEFHSVVDGNVTHNILIGIAYLVELKTKHGEKYGNAWFVLYNTGPYRPPRAPRETKYYKKVVREINRLKVKRYFTAR